MLAAWCQEHAPGLKELTVLCFKDIASDKTGEPLRQLCGEEGGHVLHNQDRHASLRGKVW